MRRHTGGWLVLAVLLFSWTVVGATTWVVDDDGGAGVDFTSIQAAINAASDGDTITVAAGLYNEALNVNKELTITGAGSGAVTINVVGGSYNNSGIYVSADNVSLSGFTAVGSLVSSTPRYGIKFGTVDNGSLSGVVVQTMYRSGLDFLGTTNTTITDVVSQNNGGHGLSLCDTRNITVTGITVAGNGWQGVSVVTWGRYSPLGTWGVVFNGTNTFTDLFQLEQGKYPSGPPEPITFSTDPADGADVTVQASDFTYALWGDDDQAPTYQRVYFLKTLADAKTAAAVPGKLGHMETTGRYIQSIEDRSQLVVSPGCSLQAAASAAIADDTIHVDPGLYAGAAVDEDITVSGDTGLPTIINDGVHYGGGHPTLETGVRLDAGADGSTFSHLVFNCDAGANYYFAVFSRNVDDVTLSNLVVNDTVQGISNWGGSGWQILDSVITDTIAAGGGGIGIYLGALPSSYKTCSNNLVQGNLITSNASAMGYTCPGICLAMDLRYGQHAHLDGSEDLGGNEIRGNLISDSGVVNGVGIELGVITTGIDPALVPGLIASTLGAIHDTTIAGNTILAEDLGLYMYTVANTDTRQNVIANCVTAGIYMADGTLDNVFRYNSITGNAVGLENTTGQLVDAAVNWWGDATGPSGAGTGSGDAVSLNVAYSPWLGLDPDGDALTVGIQLTSPLLIIVDDIGPEPPKGYLGTAFEAATDVAGTDQIEVRDGTFDVDEPLGDGTVIYGNVGLGEDKPTITGTLRFYSDDVDFGRPLQGFTVLGDIEVNAVDGGTVEIHWNDILGNVANAGGGTVQAQLNYWGTKDTGAIEGRLTGDIDYWPILPMTANDAYQAALLLLDSPLAWEMSQAVVMMLPFGTIEDVERFIADTLAAGHEHRRLRWQFGRPTIDVLPGGAGGGEGDVPGVIAVGEPIAGSFQLFDPVTGELLGEQTVTLTLMGSDNTLHGFLVATYNPDDGTYSYSFDSSGLEPGIYTVMIQTGERCESFEVEVAE